MYLLVLNAVFDEPNIPTEFVLLITAMTVWSWLSVISCRVKSEFSWGIVGCTLRVAACVTQVMTVYGLSFQLRVHTVYKRYFIIKEIYPNTFFRLAV